MNSYRKFHTRVHFVTTILLPYLSVVQHTCCDCCYIYYVSSLRGVCSYQPTDNSLSHTTVGYLLGCSLYLITMTFTVEYTGYYCDDNIGEVTRKSFDNVADAWRYMTAAYDEFDEVELVISQQDTEEIPF